MSKTATIVTVSVITVLALVGAWWFIMAQPGTSNKDSTPSTSRQSTETTTATTPTASGITIVFTDDGFEKQSYTVAAGQSVTVKNNSTIEVEFSSDDHPTHTDNSELNMDVLFPGKEQTFIPTKAGTWGIHNHKQPELTTTLVVT